MSSDQCARPERWATLTRREREILLLVETGATTKEIAATLGNSIGTVKTHLGRIYAKLGIHNRVQAAAFARRLRHALGERHENA